VSDTSYFGYYKPYCAESFINAIIDLQKYLESDGPFDGIIAFSQGASLASAFVADKPRLLISGLRCGVFFSGRTPFIDSGTESHSFSSTEDLSRAENVTINIPTVHIWGANDRMEPGQAAELSELCLHQEKHIYIHSGGHEVPGPKDKEGLVESVNAIRSMLAQL
jgi:predicted esterase